MDLKFDLIMTEPPKSSPISVAVSEEMKKDIQRFKRASERNRKLFNDLARQFFAQLIKKYDAGEFDESENK